MKGAFIRDLEELPYIQATNRIKGAHLFYKVLNRTVRTLRTLGALSEVEGMKHSILKKLGPIREIIIMKEPWETWTLQDIVHHLGRYVACTPIDHKETSAKHTDQRATIPRPSGPLPTKTITYTTQLMPCVYCRGQHSSKYCIKVVDVMTRQEKLKKSNLCFNCTSARHSINNCTSQYLCGICSQKHHTSICHKNSDNKGNWRNDDEEKGQVERTAFA